MKLILNEIISPDDHMASPDPAAYFNTSRTALECILVGLEAAARPSESIASVLDFGSGYGRVYRALAAAFPHSSLTAADLMGAAARFCAENFGGDWVESDEDVLNVKLPRQYDLVWLGSVFTHLPEHRWRLLLDFLASNTTLGGIVVFTTHGVNATKHFHDVVMKRNPYMVPAERFDAMLATLPKTGFDFIATPPAVQRHQLARGMAVSDGEYGFSFATEGWVRELIESHPNWDLVHYAAPGWGNNHDAATLRRVESKNHQGPR